MKGAAVLSSVLILQLAVSGCYTVLPTVETESETTEVILFYPVPPYIPPAPCPHPVPFPIYPPPGKKPYPIVRRPDTSKEKIKSTDQIRDSLHGHGERNKEDRNTRGRN